MKQKNLLKITFLFSILLLSYNSFAQLSIDAGSTNYTIDFDNTLSGVNNGVFNGSGLTPTPASGNLDSDAWQIIGLSDGDHNFGDTNTSGDFARGTETGGSASGGISAFEVASSNFAFGFQGTGSDFTPGTIVLKIFNNTGAPITSIDVAYKIWVYNDQGRGSTLNFAHSADDSSYTDVGALDHTTTLAADGSPAWVSTDKSTTIGSLNIAPGLSYYIRWSSEDAGGSGSRDEIAIDDIVVNATTGAATKTVGFDAATSSITETDSDIITSGIPISLINYDTDITITPTVNGSSTVEPADYTIDLTPIVFNANETNNIPLTIHDDADMDNETIIIDFTVTSGTATLGISQHTVTITDDDLPNIIINEILADDGTLDANGDSSTTGSSDEFIEFVNLDNVSYDLTGYTISDSGSIQYTFGATTIPAGGSVVVFSGGTPTGILGISLTAGGLSLNNSGGDTVTLANSGGSTISTYTYGNEATNTIDQSIGRSNDSSGSLIRHTAISTNPVTASPGRTNASGLPFTPLTWAGTTNNWETNANWSSGVAPTASDDVVIPTGLTIYPSATTVITVNSLTIGSGASLIATNTISGTVTYNRSLTNGMQWYLMSSPVVGETYDSGWVSNNSILSGQNDNRGVSTYDNTSLDTDTGAGDTATGNWRYLQDDNSNSGTFDAGQGYGVIRDGAGVVSFTGSGVYTSTQTFSITQGAINNFNMVGNPFTSYLNLGDFFTDNPITTVLVASEAYFWNGATYNTRTSLIDGSYEIAPGQGFFVEAAADTNLTFDINDTNHLADTTEGSDTFQKTSRPEIHLFISEGKNSRYANIYYIDGTTTGFDNGYDGKLFAGIKHSFALYTHLVSDSKGKNYQLQSLPNSDYENMIVPIGVNAEAGKKITFSAEVLNLPTGIKVFLEDKLTSTFTRLDEVNSSYKVTSDSAFDGIGRFYLHTKSSVLSVDDINMQNISMYTTNKTNLRIVGLSEAKSYVKIFNILGKQVLHTSFNSKSGVQNISLPNLSSGIYIVQLETETGTLNKKITLE